MIEQTEDSNKILSYLREIDKIKGIEPTDERKVIFCNDYNRLGKSLR